MFFRECLHDLKKERLEIKRSERHADSSLDRRGEPEKMSEREGRKHECQQCLYSKQLSQCVICVLCMTSTPQSVWDLRGHIRSSGWKIQILKPCIWQFMREDRKTRTLQTKRRNIQLWFVPLLKFTSGDFLFHVKLLTMQLQPILILCSNPFCVQTARSAHCNTGRLDISPQILLSGHVQKCVQGGWTVESLLGVEGWGYFLKKNYWDGGLQLRLSGKGSVSFVFSGRLLFSDPSVLTTQRTDARNAAIKTALGPAGENWAKLTTHILEHTQSHHKMTCRLYCLAFQ